MTQLNWGDQADGLRRLVTAGHLRTLAWIGARNAGKTTLITRFAQALALMGSDPVVLLEKQGSHWATLGTPLYAGAVVGEERTVLQSTRKALGIRLGLKPTFAEKGRYSLRQAFAWWQQSFLEIQQEANLVLIEQTAEERDPNPLVVTATAVLLLLSPQKESITAAYAWMKQLAKDYGREHFYVLVNQADAASASRLFEHFRATSQQHIGVGLSYLGAVPLDENLPLSRYLVGNSEKGYREVTRYDGQGWMVLRRLAAESYGWLPRDGSENGGIESLTERIISVLQMRGMVQESVLQ